MLCAPIEVLERDSGLHSLLSPRALMSQAHVLRDGRAGNESCLKSHCHRGTQALCLRQGGSALRPCLCCAARPKHRRQTGRRRGQGRETPGLPFFTQRSTSTVFTQRSTSTGSPTVRRDTLEERPRQHDHRARLPHGVRARPSSRARTRSDGNRQRVGNSARHVARADARTRQVFRHDERPAPRLPFCMAKVTMAVPTICRAGWRTLTDSPQPG